MSHTSIGIPWWTHWPVKVSRDVEDGEESHQASLSLPSVQEAITKGRPLIAEFGERHVTTPLGGQGLG